MMEIYDGYTNKDFNRNYNKLQEVTILFWTGRTSKPNLTGSKWKFA
jgi:hypothetical protein